jgi:hypothetical protein
MYQSSKVMTFVFHRLRDSKHVLGLMFLDGGSSHHRDQRAGLRPPVLRSLVMRSV